jgi:hypothetical protein
VTERTNNEARLFFRDIEIGKVIEDDADFPTVFGAFRPAEVANDSPLGRKIQRYIEYSITADKLMEEDEEKWDEFAAQNEPLYLDLIETDDWHLKYESQTDLIMIPIFGQDNSIRWRWNVKT